MPLYEYRCDGCGEVFEVMQKFSDQPLTTHEKCGGSVHRLLSAPALQFKGSGWYITDYAKGSGSKANGGSKKEDTSSKTDSSTGASSDSSSKATPSTSSSTSDTK